jgi:hypothetical protein
MQKLNFLTPANPMQYQIFKKEPAMDTLRNTTTQPIDHVAKLSYKVEVVRLATLFDGNEKGLSWD